jgi:hypothetical protein
MIKSSVFSLLPNSSDGSNRIYSGPTPQQFTLQVYNQAMKLAALRWDELASTHGRRIHVAFVPAGLDSVAHVHPEDFSSGRIGNGTRDWTFEAVRLVRV